MRSFLRTFVVILLVCWMGFIFYMSAQPADVSSEISGGFIEAVAEKVYPDFENLSKSERTDVVASFQFTVRKAAHIASFGLLGFLAFLSFVSYTRLRFFTRVFWALFISVIYAAGDELHQKIVRGRSCELRDFLLDTAGVFAVILLTVVFIKIIPPLRRKTDFIGKEKVMPSKEIFSDAKIEDSVIDRATGELLEGEEDAKTELQAVILEQQQTIDSLQTSLDKTTAENKQLRAEIKEFEMNPKTEEKLSEDFKFAASYIGKVTVEVTKVCNKLLSDAKNENAKELVNLALGRNEVFKANVLKILGEQIDLDQKKTLIEKERNEAFDYFNSILAQNC